MKKILSFYICTLLSFYAFAQNKAFKNISTFGSYSHTPTYAVTQDASGFLWIGTRDGLFRYDGSRYLRYHWEKSNENSLPHNTVNVIAQDKSDTLLWIGTEAGAALYNERTDKIQRLAYCGYNCVKTILTNNDDMWFGTTSGLIAHNQHTNQTTHYSNTEAERYIPSNHIASSLQTGNKLYFGAYDNLYCISENNLEVHPINIPHQRTNNLIICITADKNDSSYLWLGTEQGLVRYHHTSRRLQVFLPNIPIKCFYHDKNDKLWVGTDQGLYVKDEGNHFSSYQHSVGNSSSLLNNVIWSMYMDAQQNMWLCTDHGLSVTSTNAPYTYHDLLQLTGSNDGNDITTIASDKRQCLWLGTTNGLIYIDSIYAKTVWYKSDKGRKSQRLLHNKIRALHADQQGVWIASDGGLNRYDYQTSEIHQYKILKPDGSASSNWTYAIAEDKKGNLWLGTYDGLYVLSKVDLMQSEGIGVLPLHYFSENTSPRLSNSVVQKIIVTDTVAFVMTSVGVEQIDLSNYSVRYVKTPTGEHANTIYEHEGEVWLGCSAGLYRITDNLQLAKVPLYSSDVQHILGDSEETWVIGNSKVLAWNRSATKWREIATLDRKTFCAFKQGRNILLGTIDGYISIDTKRVGNEQGVCEIRISSLIIDNKRVEVGEELLGDVVLDTPIHHAKQIELPYLKNSFSLEFSTGGLGQKDGHFSYRLKGFNATWQHVSNSNHATFINIPPGAYVFEVCELGTDGVSDSMCTRLPIVIKSPWYATVYALLVYVLIFLLFTLWIIQYFRISHRLQIEHIERRKTQELVNMKSDFLAHVSHEFKTPLSIILGYLDRTLLRHHAAIRSKELDVVKNNAEKIHVLIDKLVKYNDKQYTDLFIPTASSLMGLVQKVFDSFQAMFRERDLNAQLIGTNIDYLFTLDKVKMESALENLLSNAVKFTPRGGSVVVTVSITKENSDMLWAEIKVQDSGCGILNTEIPLLFNQYYKAPSNQAFNVNGTGIGLHLVKQIVEQHKGSVSVSSEEGVGTCFAITLSTLKANSFIIRSEEDSDLTLHKLSEVWQHERKPIILLVEDNQDIQDFIISCLQDDYTILTANNGKEGLAIVNSEKVDLIITDVQMPEMDGLAMSSQIRSCIKTAFLPIIVLTGKNDNKTELEAMACADAFIAKPFNMTYLTTAIIKLLIKHEQYLHKQKEQQLLPPPTEVLESPNEKFLMLITGIVNRHIEDFDFSVNELSEASGYSSKQLYRKTKELTGMTVVEFIRDMRLQRAAMLIGQEKLSISEVMYMSGFSNTSYFSKCFKAKFGATPSDYKIQ